MNYDVKGTRYADPFYCGRAELSNRFTASALRNYFAEKTEFKNMKNRKPQDKMIDKLKEIADYLYDNGEQQAGKLAKIFGMKPSHMKTNLTYMYPVYEDDKGYIIGILDNNFEPVKFGNGKRINKKLIKNYIEIKHGGETKYFRTLKNAGEYCGVTYKTVSKLVNGKTPQSLKGYEAKWVKKPQDKKL